MRVLLVDADDVGRRGLASAIAGFGGSAVEAASVDEALRAQRWCGPLDAAIFAASDEMAIGCANNKTTAVRIIPAPGKEVGDFVHFGGLLGEAPVMDARLVERTGEHDWHSESLFETELAPLLNVVEPPAFSF